MFFNGSNMPITVDFNLYNKRKTIDSYKDQ